MASKGTGSGGNGSRAFVLVAVVEAVALLGARGGESASGEDGAARVALEARAEGRGRSAERPKGLKGMWS